MPGESAPAVTFVQCPVFPTRHSAQSSSIPRTSQWSGGDSATRSPIATRLTWAPVSTTSPTTSCPKTNGVETKGEK